MAATFHEVLPHSGFDYHIPSGGPGIVIPYKGSNSVRLDGGKGVTLTTAMGPMLSLLEIKDQNYLQEIWLSVEQSCGDPPGSVIADTLMSIEAEGFRTGEIRIFKIIGNSFVPLGKAKIEAKNPRTRTVEESLQVIVLKKKVVKIAIRPVQFHNAAGILVNSSAITIDPPLLLNQMNRIWNSQANIFFEMSRTGPVTIDRLRDAPADFQDSDLKADFIANRDPGADLTFFMVKLALNEKSAVSGVIDSEARYALVSDGPLESDNTMAHEAGHYLGSLNEAGKFSQHYPDRESGSDLLMADGGSGYRIPFSDVTDFNKGYRR